MDVWTAVMGIATMMNVAMLVMDADEHRRGGHMTKMNTAVEPGS